MPEHVVFGGGRAYLQAMIRSGLACIEFFNSGE